MDTEAVCQETYLSYNLITLPPELLVYIMSLLVIRDKINLRYVSRRFRCVSEIAILWSDFIWPYFESNHEHYVSDTLRACGKHVEKLMFPINVPPSKVVWLTETCVNVKKLSLPTRAYFRSGQLERIVNTMTHLQKLDVCWSDYIKPLLEISGNLKELTIRMPQSKKFKYEPPAWDVEDWVREGIHLPSVVKIFIHADFYAIEYLYEKLSKYSSSLPDGELFFYSNARIPISCHPQIPLLRCNFGPAGASYVVTPSNYGILGFRNDRMNILEFDYDDKIMYCGVLSCFAIPQNVHHNVRFLSLSSITFLSMWLCSDIFPGHLEQIAIACPNLRWLDLQGCCDSLQSLKGLQSIVTICQDLQGMNIADIPVAQVESYLLLWLLISSISKLTHLTLGSCLLKVPEHVNSQTVVSIFQSCHKLQALEGKYGGCEECLERSTEDLLLSYFPSLVYFKLSYDNPCILETIITTCKNLKYLCYDNCVNAISLPLSFNCRLQQLCLESKHTDMPDSFMDVISLHGGLEHLILSVRSITISGIYTVISNSPNLMSFCTFINQPLCNKHGRKMQSKDFKIKVKKQFRSHKLFTAGTFRLAVGNQFFHQYDVLPELNTDLNPIWNHLIFRV